MSSASRNSFVFAALMCAAIAAGCSGGGGGTPSIATPPPGGGVTFPPPPTAVPTNNSWQPSPGPTTNFYQFGQIITEEMIRPPVTQSPIPSPNPTVSAVYVWNSAITTYATSGHTFPATGQTGLVDFNSTEVDTGAYGALNTVTTLSDTYYDWVPNASNSALTNVYVVGSIAQRAAGTIDQTTFTTIYYPGSGPQTNGLIDVVPEPTKTGQSVPVGPANDASMKTIEQDADGQVTTRVVDAKGGYVETVTYPDGTKATATEQDDGEATYSLPLGGAPDNSTVTVGKPTGSGIIPITVKYAQGAFGRNAQTLNLNIPVWYPPSFALYQQTYINKGPTALPNPFPVPAPNPTSTPVCDFGPGVKFIQQKPYSNKLVQTTNRVDTLFGEQETEVTNTWNTQGVGLTCAETIDTVNQYYDYSGQSYQIPSYQSTPQQVSTYDFQMALGQANIGTESYRFGRGYSQMRSRGRQRSIRSGPMGRVGRMGSMASGPGSPALLLRSLSNQLDIRLERERIARHASYWRQVKELSKRKYL